MSSWSPAALPWRADWPSWSGATSASFHRRFPRRAGSIRLARSTLWKHFSAMAPSRAPGLASGGWRGVIPGTPVAMILFLDPMSCT